MDFPLVPVIIIFVELGENLLIEFDMASAFASSIFSVIINGNPNF